MEIDNALIYYCVHVSHTSLLHASLGDDGNILTLTCEGVLFKIAISTTNSNPQVALKIASSEEFFSAQFERYLLAKNF